MTTNQFKEVLNINLNTCSSNEKKVLEKAFENYKNNVVFNDCEEEKILKLISFIKRTAPKKILMFLCKYISKEDLQELKKFELKNFNELSFEEVKDLRKKIINYRNVIKNKEFLFILEFILSVLLFKWEGKEEFLDDNKLTLEKLMLFNDKELLYISKKPCLLDLIKKVSYEKLKKIKDKKDNKDGTNNS